MGKRAAWLLGGAIVLALAATFVAPYLPAALGGPASYALVEGDGIEPKLAAGDLAVFRTSDSYEVGDVVAYKATQGRVIARVVARHKAGYVLAQDIGDGSLRVSTGQITGSLETVLPRAGTALSWLREPVHMLALPAAAALLGVALLVAGGLQPRLAGRRNPGATGRLPRRWRRFVVPVSGRLDVGGDVIDVTSLAGLVALARQSGRIVLEVAEVGGRHLARERRRRRLPLPFGRPGVRRGGSRDRSPTEPLAATLERAETGMLAPAGERAVSRRERPRALTERGPDLDARVSDVRSPRAGLGSRDWTAPDSRRGWRPLGAPACRASGAQLRALTVNAERVAGDRNLLAAHALCSDSHDLFAGTRGTAWTVPACILDGRETASDYLAGVRRPRLRVVREGRQRGSVNALDGTKVSKKRWTGLHRQPGSTRVGGNVEKPPVRQRVASLPLRVPSAPAWLPAPRTSPFEGPAPHAPGRATE